MKRKRRLINRVYLAAIIMVIATTIVCIVTVYILSVSTNEELFKKKLDAMNLYGNLIHETIEEPLQLLDMHYDNVEDRHIFPDMYDRYFSYLEMNIIEHNLPREEQWTSVYDKTAGEVIFTKRFVDQGIELIFPLDVIYEILNQDQTGDLVIMDRYGVMLGRQESLLPNLTLDQLSSGLEVVEIENEKYIIKELPYLEWYLVINFQSEDLNRTIQKIILQILAAWLSLSTALMLLVAQTVKRVQEDMSKIEKRTVDIGEGEYAVAPTDFAYKETYDIDHLLYEMGVMVEERSIEIHTMNAQLEELVEERTSEVLTINKKLQEEIKERKEIENEIRSMNRTLDRTVHERTDELRRLNQELMKNITMANEANEAKSKFLAVMSHEMRTPLNGIIGFAHMLTLEIKDTNQKKTLDMILNSSKVLLALINDVLDFAKYESGKMTFESYVFNLKEEIEEILESFSLLCGNKELKFSSSGLEYTNYYVKSDATKIKQVFNNILNNGLKFTSKGGMNVVLNTEVRGDDLYLSVIIKDTGVGMGQDTLEQLFEPFVQGKEAVHTHGTGLGLAITKEIIENFEGDIIFKSTPNKGTTCSFNMKLSIAEKSEDVMTEIIKHLNYNHILYVEDNLVNQKLMAKFFDKYHVDYEIAVDGKDAVKKFKEGHYDLIFMDLQMPVMDGYEASRMIRDLDEEVTIIAMTAYTTKDVKDQCLEVGMNDYISKPVDLNYLTALLGLVNESSSNQLEKRQALIEAHAEKLSQILLFDFDVCKELLMTFVHQLDQAMEKMESYIIEEEYDELTKLIHKMKGGASTVRLKAIFEHLETAERQLDIKNIDGVKEILNELKKEEMIKK